MEVNRLVNRQAPMWWGGKLSRKVKPKVLGDMHRKEMKGRKGTLCFSEGFRKSGRLGYCMTILL